MTSAAAAPAVAATAPPFVRLHGISKSFAGTRALTDVSLDLRLGEIHALVGENGAGKSTLSKVLYGVYPPDAGEVDFAGDGARGITMVHQELTVIPTLSIAENVLMGIEPSRGLSSTGAARTSGRGSSCAASGSTSIRAGRPGRCRCPASSSWRSPARSRWTPG